MADLFNTFYTVLSPIVLVALLGFILDRRFRFDTKSISRLVIYLASPALVFSSVSQSTLQAQELWQLLAFTVLVMTSIAAISWGVAKLFRLPQKEASAFSLASTLTNAGNFGVPFISFAFGIEGLGRAVIIYTGTSIVANTLGVFLASRGSASVWKSLGNVLHVPLPYALALGLMANFGVFSVPLPFERAFSMLGGAAVPLMLLVLGTQLSRIRMGARLQWVTLAAVLKLILAPILGVFFARLLLLGQLTASIAIIQISMPTAVLSIVLAEEFGSDTQFVSGVLIFSTLASLLTLSILLQIFA